MGHPLAQGGCRAAHAQQGSIAHVATIRGEVERLDAAFDTPRAPAQTKRLVEWRNWHVRALYESGAPVVVHALFTQGRLSREERYYFPGGRLAYVAVEQFWDDAQPGERARKAEYFVHQGRIVRSLGAIQDGQGTKPGHDGATTADRLTRRSAAILRMLATPAAHDAESLRTLEVFPWSEP